jgi:NAD-dependent dihydropyrimidine dehydrogenase PreA subunit
VIRCAAEVTEVLAGDVMKIISEKCEGCLSCVDVCPVRAISQKNGKIVINKNECIGCGCCASSCPNDAIEYE